MAGRHNLHLLVHHPTARFQKSRVSTLHIRQQTGNTTETVKKSGRNNPQKTSHFDTVRAKTPKFKANSLEFWLKTPKFGVRLPKQRVKILKRRANGLKRWAKRLKRWGRATQTLGKNNQIFIENARTSHITFRLYAVCPLFILPQLYSYPLLLLNIMPYPLLPIANVFLTYQYW